MEIIQRLADFRVTYRFFTHAEGGRRSYAIQGYRPDWVYAEDYSEEAARSPSFMPVFMIIPVFVDENGLVYDRGEIIPLEGFANMHILNDQLRPIHRRRIKVGTKGYFVEGSRRVAEATVIDILYLNHNEHEPKIEY